MRPSPVREVDVVVEEEATEDEVVASAVDVEEVSEEDVA